MALPNSYTLKTGAVPAYFDAMLDAQPPERFSTRFMENLGFTSTNDRLFIGILKELGFLNSDGAPQQRYFDFLDKSRSRHVVADGVRDAFADLFAVNTKANDLTADDVKNKLRTLYKGTKPDTVIDRIAKTFSALCEYADFTPSQEPSQAALAAVTTQSEPPASEKAQDKMSEASKPERAIRSVGGAVTLESLQYHINIVLPDTRDQAVFDAIFKSLREHLGARHG